MTKTATLIGEAVGRFRGDARHYRLSEPLNGHSFVIVSAVGVPYTGPETFIFPANEAGEVESWLEMEGSYRGGLSHMKALSNAGYEIA